MIIASIVGGCLLAGWCYLIGRCYEKADWEDATQPVKSWKQLEKEYLEARGL